MSSSSAMVGPRPAPPKWSAASSPEAVSEVEPYVQEYAGNSSAAISAPLQCTLTGQRAAYAHRALSREHSVTE